MTLPEVYAIFSYWDSSPPVSALLRRIGVYGLGIKPAHMGGKTAPQSQEPAPARTKAAPDKARPLPDPLPEHDRSVEAFVAQSGGTLPTAKVKKEISLEDFIAKLTGTPP